MIPAMAARTRKARSLPFTLFLAASASGVRPPTSTGTTNLQFQLLGGSESDPPKRSLAVNQYIATDPRYGTTARSASTLCVSVTGKLDGQLLFDSLKATLDERNLRDDPCCVGLTSCIDIVGIRHDPIPIASRASAPGRHFEPPLWVVGSDRSPRTFEFPCQVERFGVKRVVGKPDLPSPVSLTKRLFQEERELHGTLPPFPTIHGVVIAASTDNQLRGTPLSCSQ